MGCIRLYSGEQDCRSDDVPKNTSVPIWNTLLKKTLTQRTLYALRVLQLASICLDSQTVVSCKPARPCENFGLRLQEKFGPD